MLYLSAPYSDSSAALRNWRAARCAIAMADLMAKGRLVVCPATMNHEAVSALIERAADPGRSYWQALERKLATSCDELVVLKLPGWAESRGVAREIALFTEMDKPITFIDEAVGDGEKAPK